MTKFRVTMEVIRTMVPLAILVIQLAIYIKVY
jgi:hypothetical protein